MSVMRWEVSLPVVACDAGEDFITRIFAPLGYEVASSVCRSIRVSSVGTRSNLYDVRLSGAQTVQDVLSHSTSCCRCWITAKHYYIRRGRDGEAAAPRRRVAGGAP